MRRRDFIAELASAPLAWPLAAAAQPTGRMRRVGALMPFRETDPVMQASVKAFVGGLAELGWVGGQNLRVEYRFAAGDPKLFNTYAAELVALSPDALLASSTAAIEALAQRTDTIPIVFVLVVDPVGQGIVESLARPGGNITGFGMYDAQLMSKWLQLLNEIAPAVSRAAVLFNPETAPFAPLFTDALKAASPSFGITVMSASVHDDAGIEATAAALAGPRGGSLIDLPESFSVTHRNAIIAAAARHQLPLMGATELFPRTGGLISYWFDTVDVHREAASYIDHILKGTKPADLPVQEPTKFELVINMKTAKALGLTVPQSLLARADEVIE
jgi:putative ABC transport system substrate-binding protein